MLSSIQPSPKVVVANFSFCFSFYLHSLVNLFSFRLFVSLWYFVDFFYALYVNFVVYIHLIRWKAYNTCKTGYFASCVVFFRPPPPPAGARKNTSNEQNVRSYHMLNHRIRGLLFHYKKKLSGNWLLFFGKSIQRHPDSVCENDVNN